MDRFHQSQLKKRKVTVWRISFLYIFKVLFLFMNYYFRVAEVDREFQEEDEEWTQREEIINKESLVETKKDTKKDGRVWQHDETVRLIDLCSDRNVCIM